MLFYDRIDVSKGINVSKTNESKECNIFHWWFFLDKVFKFQPDVCNGCHDVSMMSMNLTDIVMIITLIIVALLAGLAKLRLST